MSVYTTTNAPVCTSTNNAIAGTNCGHTNTNGNCNGSVVVDRNGNCAALCTRYLSLIIRTNRSIGRNRLVNCINDAKHSDNGRYRFRVQHGNSCVTPRGIFGHDGCQWVTTETFPRKGTPLLCRRWGKRVVCICPSRRHEGKQFHRSDPCTK